MCGAYGTYEYERERERRGEYTAWVGKPERKKPLGKQRRKWKNNSEIKSQKKFGETCCPSLEDLYLLSGAYVYFLLVVYSFHCLLPMLSSQRIAILLNRFKNPYLHHKDESDHVTTEGCNVTATPRFSSY